MAEEYRRFAACCTLVLACAGSLPISFSGAAGTAPVARAEPSTPAAIGESRVLAERILRRESHGLLFEPGRLRGLAREIGEILETLRERHPVLATVRARPRQSPATLLVGFDAGLFDAVAGLRDRGGLPAMPPTGNTAFDALNAKLGVRRLRVFPALRVAALDTGGHVNIEAARKAYLAIDGVISAEPDASLGDGSDIEAAKADGLWHVVFRWAWGDCPSGCTNAELFFFTVDGGAAKPVDRRRAVVMAAFAALLASRGWD